MKAPISRFTVSGHSMLPALRPGQNVVSFNWAYLGGKPKAGDIVVIQVNGRELIKRVQSIHDGEVFVTGDNEEESTDSRHFGPVSLDQITGKVIYQSRSDLVDCPNCEWPVPGVYGRKDAICSNCGFKLTCCGEP